MSAGNGMKAAPSDGGQKHEPLAEPVDRCTGEWQQGEAPSVEDYARRRDPMLLYAARFLFTVRRDR